MPSTSKKQHNFMEAVANNPAFAKKAGVPQSVGKEFESADKGLKFDKAPTKSRADLQKINKPETRHGKSQFFNEGGHMATKKMMKGGITTAKMGSVKAGGKRPHGEHSVQQKGHTRGMEPKMSGSKPLGMKKGGKAKC